MVGNIALGHVFKRHQELWAIRLIDDTLREPERRPSVGPKMDA